MAARGSVLPAAGRRSASWLCRPRATSPAWGGSGQSQAERGWDEGAGRRRCVLPGQQIAPAAPCLHGGGLPRHSSHGWGAKGSQLAAKSCCWLRLRGLSASPCEGWGQKSPCHLCHGADQGPAPALPPHAGFRIPTSSCSRGWGQSHRPPPTPNAEFCPSTSLPCAATALGTVSPWAATRCLPPPAPSLPGVTPHPKCWHQAAPGAAPHLGTRPAQG